MQKKLVQIISSTLLLLLGASVLGVSLHGAHARNLRVKEEWRVEESSKAALILDVQMPGSLPYLAFRVQDRVEDASLPTKDQSEVYLGRSRQRTQSANYAFRHGQSEVAFTTIMKAYVYLHKAAHSCQPGITEDTICNDLQPLFVSVGDELAETLSEFSARAESDDLRARLEGLLDQLQVLRSQFSF